MSKGMLKGVEDKQQSIVWKQSDGRKVYLELNNRRLDVLLVLAQTFNGALEVFYPRFSTCNCDDISG